MSRIEISLISGHVWRICYVAKFNNRTCYHREDGPAIEYLDGYRIWLKYGKRHREDGPAAINPDGKKEYWLNGCLQKITRE